MSDLVKRLRERDRFVRGACGDHVTLYAEAADEIERLTRDRDEACVEVNEQARLLGMGSEREAKLVSERDEARESEKALMLAAMADIPKLVARAEAAELQVAALREALDTSAGMLRESVDAAIRAMGVGTLRKEARASASADEIERLTRGLGTAMGDVQIAEQERDEAWVAASVTKERLAVAEVSVAALREACDLLLRCSLPNDVSGMEMVDRAQAVLADTAAAARECKRRLRIEGAAAMDMEWRTSPGLMAWSTPLPLVKSGPAVVDAKWPAEVVKPEGTAWAPDPDEERPPIDSED